MLFGELVGPIRLVDKWNVLVALEKSISYDAPKKDSDWVQSLAVKANGLPETQCPKQKKSGNKEKTTRNVQNLPKDVGLKLRHYKAVFYLLLIGNSLSFFIFFAELFVQQFQIKKTIITQN